MKQNKTDPSSITTLVEWLEFHMQKHTLTHFPIKNKHTSLWKRHVKSLEAAEGFLSFYSMHKVASMKEHIYRQVLTSYSWRIA